MQPTRLRFSALYAAAAIVILCVLAGFGPAERHARGSVWIHRSDGCATMLHAEGDSLCELGFPGRCWGGMMSPDSLFCRFWTTPPESLPPHCLFAYRCSVQDPAGRSMMSGHMMGAGFFRQPIDVTLHFDAAALWLQGLVAGDLALVIPQDGGYQVVDATADPASATFRVDPTRLSSWYGIVARKELAATSATWSEVKAKYRH
jgi:hypothetical protein